IHSCPIGDAPWAITAGTLIASAARSASRASASAEKSPGPPIALTPLAPCAPLEENDVARRALAPRRRADAPAPNRGRGEGIGVAAEVVAQRGLDLGEDRSGDPHRGLGLGAQARRRWRRSWRARTSSTSSGTGPTTSTPGATSRIGRGRTGEGGRPTPRATG